MFEIAKYQDWQLSAILLAAPLPTIPRFTFLPICDPLLVVLHPTLLASQSPDVSSVPSGELFMKPSFVLAHR